MICTTLFYFKVVNVISLLNVKHVNIKTFNRIFYLALCWRHFGIYRWTYIRQKDVIVVLFTRRGVVKKGVTTFGKHTTCIKPDW